MTSKLKLIANRPGRLCLVDSLTQINLHLNTNTALLAMFAIVLFFPISVFAVNTKAGTSGAQFLKIGTGSRVTAMGDSFVGVADDVNATLVNPAGLTQIQSPELIGMHTQWIQGLNYDLGAYAMPTSIGSFGLSAVTLKASDIEKRNADESFSGTFESLDAAYGVSYAHLVGPVSIGGTLKYIHQEIDSNSASAMAADIGLFKQFNDQLTLGLALRNFGEKIKFQSESDSLPTVIDLGVGSKFFNKKFLTSLDVRKPNDDNLAFGLGVEWNQKIHNDFSFSGRSGYSSEMVEDNGSSGFALGGGLGYKEFMLDVAWVPFGALGNTFRYAAHIKF